MIIKFEAIKTWQSVPGPWFVKVVILAVLIAIPGGFDEIIFFAALAAWRSVRRAYLTRKAVGGEAVTA
jgi:hypothetical protein